jgi:hypothetical protein
METWGSGGIAPPFLTSALDGGEWSASSTGRFTPGEIASGSRWIEGWVGPRAGLDAVDRRNLVRSADYKLYGLFSGTAF